MIELLQVSQLPPFLLERLQGAFRLHDFIDPADPEKLLDDVGPRIRGILAGGMKGPNAHLINRLEKLEIIASFSVGFDATGPSGERNFAADKWDEWWKKR